VQIRLRRTKLLELSPGRSSRVRHQPGVPKVADRTLAVLPIGVVDKHRHGSLVFQFGVRQVMVVVVEPDRQGVETLLVSRLELRHHPLDVNSQASEVGCRVQEELLRLRAVVGDPDLRVGNSRAIVNCDRDKLPASASSDSRPFTEQGMTAAERNSAQLLDVDVEQITRPLSDIANTQAGRSVAITQPSFTLPAQNRVYGRPCQPQRGSNSMRTRTPAADVSRGEC
jgi:hypothetical protein